MYNIWHHILKTRADTFSYFFFVSFAVLLNVRTFSRPNYPGECIRCKGLLTSRRPQVSGLCWGIDGETGRGPECRQSRVHAGVSAGNGLEFWGSNDAFRTHTHYIKSVGLSQKKLTNIFTINWIREYSTQQILRVRLPLTLLRQRLNLG